MPEFVVSASDALASSFLSSLLAHNGVATEPHPHPARGRDSASELAGVRPPAGSQSDTTQSTNETQPTEAAAPRKSNSWHRRKRELKQLRDDVRRLEHELKARLLCAGEPCDPRGNWEDQQRIKRRYHFFKIAWKLAAQREETLKNASINENKRLKDLVERHTKLSQALQPALFQQEACDFLSLPQQARLQSTVERASLFRALEGKLSARLPLVEEVIRHTVLQSTRPTDMFEMQVNGGETGHPVGSIQRAKTFPFSERSITDALWRCAENGFREMSPSPRAAYRLSNDSLGVDTVVRLASQEGADGSTRNIHVRGVVKRWVTDKRALIQLALVTEWSSASNSVTEEFSWSVARRNAVRQSRYTPTVGDVAHLRISIECSLLASKNARRPSNRARREVIAKTALPSICRMVQQVDQAIENILMDGAHAAAASSSK